MNHTKKARTDLAGLGIYDGSRNQPILFREGRGTRNFSPPREFPAEDVSKGIELGKQQEYCRQNAGH